MVKFRSLLVKIRSLIVQFRSLLVKIRSLLVKIRSLLVKIRSLLVKVRSVLVKIRSLLVNVRLSSFLGKLAYLVIASIKCGLCHYFDIPNIIIVITTRELLIFQYFKQRICHINFYG